MATLDQFAKYVRPEVAGCPDIILLDAIRRAGIEFCKKTKVIKEEINVTTVADTAKYPIAGTGGAYVDEVLAVQRDAYDWLTPSSFYDFKQEGYDKVSGTPRYYYMDSDNNLMLGFIPDAIETLAVTVRTIPQDNATELADLLFRRYAEQIAAGAKAKLMIQANKPWSNPQMASVNQGMFMDAISDANLREAKGSARKPLRTRPQHF